MSTATAAPSDRSALEAETRRLLALDSLLEGDAAARAVAELQAVADSATAPDVRVPALLRLGLLKLRLYAWDPSEAVRAGRPDDYFFNEIAGSWLYQGLELRELVERHPDHVLADDAAYAATGLPLGGECEGWVPCYLYAGTGRLVDFLEAYPTSDLALAAVEAINLGYETALADHPDLTVATDLYDPVEVRAALERYQAAAHRLEEPARAPALAAIARLWRRFGVGGGAP